jgi:hypothetical protein
MTAQRSQSFNRLRTHSVPIFGSGLGPVIQDDDERKNSSVLKQHLGYDAVKKTYEVAYPLLYGKAESSSTLDEDGNTATTPLRDLVFRSEILMRVSNLYCDMFGTIHE